MLTLSIKHYRVFGMSEKAVVLFSAYIVGRKSSFITVKYYAERAGQKA